MCGIVGYVGKNQSAPILLNGLAKLEYRGYDSAGIAVRDGDSPVQVVKAKGRLKVLAEKTNDGQSVIGTCGIGHTRWATHGEPSETNAHPHISDDYNVVGVHNGIIENYQELRDKLTRNGYSFYSSTDTEVAVKLTRNTSIHRLMRLTTLWCVSVVHTHLQLCLRNIRKRYMLHVRTVL
jgi:glucosamine--fructose-6-phosphate aminotransferase (isomerizing)